MSLFSRSRRIFSALFRSSRDELNYLDLVFFPPKICFMCLGPKSYCEQIVRWDVNLYFGGSSGNRGFLGPGCSDLPFLEPDILEKVTNFKTDILEKVKYFKTPQNLQTCYNSTHSLSLYASRHHQKSLTHPTFQPNYFAFSLRPTQLCHNNHNGSYQYRWFWRLLNEMLDWGMFYFWTGWTWQVNCHLSETKQ